MRSEPLAARCGAAEAETTLRAMAAENTALWSDERAIRRLWTAYFTVLLGAALPLDRESERERLVIAVVEAFERASSYRLYPDVVPALRRLREHGLQLGVISDWGIGLGLILRHHDLIDYFDFAVVSAAVGHSKPDPALFQTALARARTRSSTTPFTSATPICSTYWARARPASRRCCLTESAVTMRRCSIVRSSTTCIGLLTLLEIQHHSAE